MKYNFSGKGFLQNLLIASLMGGVLHGQGSNVACFVLPLLFMAIVTLKPFINTVVLALFGLSLSAGAHDAGCRDAMAGINREVWENHIEENLFPSNEFLLKMTDQSEYVNFLTVHIPQAGSTPVITKNPALGGAPVNPILRTDTTQDWDIDVYVTAPFLITNAEEVQLSYNKRESILYEQEMAIRQTIGDNVLIDIAPTGAAILPANMGGGTNNNILRSTGITNNDPGNVVSSAAYVSSAAIGNRLNFTLWDIRQAKKLFDTQFIPADDRCMVVSAQGMDQLVNDIIATKYRGSVGDVFDTKSGIVSKLMGFELVMRPYTVVYNNAATPVCNPYGTAGATTDNDAILFFQKAFAAYAIGDIHVYEQLNAPGSYGDIYSALIRMGATKVRSSELGIGAIVQAASV